MTVAELVKIALLAYGLALGSAFVYLRLHPDVGEKVVFDWAAKHITLSGIVELGTRNGTGVPVPNVDVELLNDQFMDRFKVALEEARLASDTLSETELNRLVGSLKESYASQIRALGDEIEALNIRTKTPETPPAPAPAPATVEPAPPAPAAAAPAKTEPSASEAAPSHPANDQTETSGAGQKAAAPSAAEPKASETKRAAATSRETAVPAPVTPRETAAPAPAIQASIDTAAALAQAEQTYDDALQRLRERDLRFLMEKKREYIAEHIKLALALARTGDRWVLRLMLENTGSFAVAELTLRLSYDGIHLRLEPSGPEGTLSADKIGTNRLIPELGNEYNEKILGLPPGFRWEATFAADTADDSLGPLFANDDLNATAQAIRVDIVDATLARQDSLMRATPYGSGVRVWTYPQIGLDELMGEALAQARYSFPEALAVANARKALALAREADSNAAALAVVAHQMAEVTAEGAKPEPAYQAAPEPPEDGEEDAAAPAPSPAPAPQPAPAAPAASTPAAPSPQPTPPAAESASPLILGSPAAPMVSGTPPATTVPGSGALAAGFGRPKGAQSEITVQRRRLLDEVAILQSRLAQLNRGEGSAFDALRDTARLGLDRTALKDIEGKLAEKIAAARGATRLAVARADGNGRFRFANVAPGSYYLFARITRPDGAEAYWIERVNARADGASEISDVITASGAELVAGLAVLPRPTP